MLIPIPISVLGPTLATQAETIGIATLYFIGAIIMFLMVGAMYLYITKFADQSSLEMTGIVCIACIVCIVGRGGRGCIVCIVWY